MQVVGYQISDGLIEPLDDDAAFGEIGIACSHLLSLLDEDSASESKTEEEERETYKSAEQTKEQAKEDAKKSKDLFENLSSFFDQEFSDAFRDLGGKVRDNIPQVIKDKVAEELLDSKWATQVGQRAQTLARMLQLGDNHANSNNDRSF